MNYSNIVETPSQKELSEIEKLERKRLLGSSEPPDPDEDYLIRVAVYARVSTDMQAKEEKASLPEQLSQCKELIKSKGWLYTGEYKDVQQTGEEADYLNREGLRQALKGAENSNFDVLVVWANDRLGRRAKVIRDIRDKFETYGVQIFSLDNPLLITDPRFFNPSSNSKHRLLEAIKDQMAEEENKMKTVRLSMGKLHKAKKGKIPCKVPYGYKKVDKPIEKEEGSFKLQTSVKIVESEAEIIRIIFDLYLNKSYGFRKIVETLNEKGLRTRKGNKWSYSTVRYMMSNPTYAGKVRWGWRLSKSKQSRKRLASGHTGIVVNGIHEAIIEEDVFIEVQKKIKKRAKLGGRAVSSRGLLTGILKCGRCGGNAYLTSFPSSYAYKKAKEGKDISNYSRCLAYKCSTVSKYGNKACKSYIIAQKKVEAYVVNKIKGLANSSEAQEAFKREIERTNTNTLTEHLSGFKSQLKELPKMKKRCSIAYRKGVMSLEDFGKNLAEIEERKRSLKNEIKSLKQKIQGAEKTKVKTKKALKVFRNFDLIWDAASFKVKKDLISDIVKEVRATADKIEIEFRL